MPTERCFAQHSPFPSDLPMAELPRISQKKLHSDDSAEQEPLIRASLDHGFFLLDFAGSTDCELILNEVEQCFDAHRDFFSLTATEKKSYTDNPSSLIFGYRPAGKLNDSQGHVDRTEWMTHIRQQLTRLTDSHTEDVTSPFASSLNVSKSTADQLHGVAVTILTALETPLQLPCGTFSALSNSNDSTLSQLRFLHITPATRSNTEACTERTPSLQGHTDNGSLTILFNILGGLQIMPPGQDPEDEASWRWVCPRPGCAVVNFGDSMVKWSGDLIRSNVHRVVDPPGLQAAEHRYSGDYFLKAAEDEIMRPLTASPVIKEVVTRDGDSTERLTSSEWNMKRNRMLLDGTYKVRNQGGRPLPASPGNWEHPPLPAVRAS